ncbi:DUF2249 domain-containing protein [Halofilum ochraceum]|uniref:DUF2249 domain-containing protein n=1 Tax=Halofilum ochraceum TaxID=1611323 RepID=UPI0008D91B75|nr:DUF2249 domain-containing protein [Halofilum ochraceum]
MTDGPNRTTPAGDSSHSHQSAIDLRRFEPHERVPLLEMSLSVLSPGESLQATFEEWPIVLVRYLERTWGERFEWWFGGAGEEWCYLEIRRLPQSQ